MLNVGILGHSQIRPFIPGGSHFPYYCHNESSAPTNYSLNFFCEPGATFVSILNSRAINNLIRSSPQLIILVLGGNDLTYSTNLGTVYDNLIYLVDHLTSACSPTYGVHILEPELRRGDPRFVSFEIYRALRNSFIRKIKAKRQVNFLPLVRYGVGLHTLSADGVHLNSVGFDKLLATIKYHISVLTSN